MYPFKGTSRMLPSELNEYIGELQDEIRALEKENDNLKTPDLFHSDDVAYESEQEMIDRMEVGDVTHCRRLKSFGETFRVKISPTRIDDCSSRIEAEHKKMLHKV